MSAGGEGEKGGGAAGGREMLRIKTAALIKVFKSTKYETDCGQPNKTDVQTKYNSIITTKYFHHKQTVHLIFSVTKQNWCSTKQKADKHMVNKHKVHIWGKQTCQCKGCVLPSVGAGGDIAFMHLKYTGIYLLKSSQGPNIRRQQCLSGQYLKRCSRANYNRVEKCVIC